MNSLFLTDTLPYAIMIGIGTSVIASIALVVSAFSKSQKSDADLLPRLAKIDSALKSYSSLLDAQLQLNTRDSQLDSARLAFSSLDEIAHDLQQRATEIQKILIDLEGDRTPLTNDRRRFSDLSRSVKQTETYLATLVQKIDDQKRTFLDMSHSRAAN